MKQTQNNVITLLLCRLVESLGLYLTLRILPSLRRRSSVVMSVVCVVFAVCSGVGARGEVYADSITLDISTNNLAVNLIPTATNGSFATSDNLTIGVALSGIGGYTLGIRASNSSNLVNSSDSSKVLSSITAATSYADFSADNSTAATNYNDKWGYLPSKLNSVANNNYQPSPSTAGAILDATSGTNDEGEYTISIGARASMETAVGEYSNTFVIVAIANASCNSSASHIFEAVCMQDMNDNVINSMVVNQQYQLVDNRDNKLYYIAKMKDGRVWMTQNLDFDIVTDTSSANYVALTSNNTDLVTFGSQNYTTTNGYACSNTSTTTNCTAEGEIITWTPVQATLANNQYASWNSSNYLPRSWDGGDYYYYTSGNTNTDRNYTLSQCTSAGHTTAECTHYHIGNYYNWSAAVASNTTSGLTSNYTAMGNSICPAGWRLPNGRTNSSSSTNPGYYSEINYTWFDEGIVSNYITSTSYATWKTTNNVTGFNAMRTAPLYMVRAGQRNGTGSMVSNPRTYGYYQTSTIYNTNYSYVPYFYSSYAYPAFSNSANAYRSYGRSVRCVARQGNTGSTTITFNKNADDATGTMNTQTINANSWGTLVSNAYNRTGYVFNGWNTQADGKGVAYTNAGSYHAATGTDNKNTTLYAQWAVNVTIKTATGISQVYIREQGSSTNLCSTSSTSGTACKLMPNTAYNLYATLSSGYSFASWTKTGAGTLSSNTAYNPVTFTTGTSATTLTPSTTPNSYNITVNFVGGVSSVTFTNATYGTQTVSSSGGTASLRHNQSYSISVTLNNGNYFVSWERTAGNGTIGNTSTMNTTFTPNASTATLRITAANTRIKTATGIDSVTVSTTGGSQVCTTTDATTGAYCNLTLGTTYNITATTHQGYTFSSWSHTGSGTIGSSTSSTTTFTPAQSSAIDVITPSATGNPYTVTIVFGNANVTSVTIDGETFTTSGGTKTLTAGTAYTISGTTDLSTVAFTSSANGVVAGNTFTLYGDATLTAEGLSKIYMQGMSGALCTSTPMEVYDSRGGEQAYMVARLNDGKCWMLQNLNLPGGTALSADDTDVTSTYISGFYTGGNLTKSGNTIVLPASATKNSGNANLTNSTQFSNNSNAYVFNSGNNTTTCNSTTPCNSYYSWIAATLGGKQANGSTAETRDGYNAAASICPKGWKLPTSTTSNANAQTSPNWKTGDWYALATAYGANLESNYQQRASTFYNNAGPGTTPNFLLAGLYLSGSFYGGGSYGDCWSATSYDSSLAYYLNFGSDFVYSALSSNRYAGGSVRCVLSE